MKLFSFNIWGGNIYSPLMRYLKSQSENVDIFCFQEVFNAPASVEQKEHRGARVHLFDELRELLPNFTGNFTVTSKNHDLLGYADLPLVFGLASFIRNDYQIEFGQAWEIFGKVDDKVDEKFTNIPRTLQQTKLVIEDKSINIFNYHGIPKPGDKLDTPGRLEQSKKLKNILNSTEGPKILCGDLNLMPQTQSITALEFGTRNLIKDFQITNTRNQVSWDKYNNIQHFADYMFVSPEIKVLDFQVPYNEVSDHLPMILEFEI